jgi:hypothetical protein
LFAWKSYVRSLAVEGVDLDGIDIVGVLLNVGYFTTLGEEEDVSRI